MSKKQELTPWFPAIVKPVRPGVYQRLWPSGYYYAMFDGEFWRTFWNTPEAAAKPWRGVSGDQFTPWRGLAKEPK